VVGGVTQWGRQRVPAAKFDAGLGVRALQGVSGLLVPRSGSGSSCGDAQWSGRSGDRRGCAIGQRSEFTGVGELGAIPVLQSENWGVAGLGSSLASRWIFCGDPQGLGCSLAVDFTAVQSPVRRSSARRGSVGFWRRL